MRIFTIIVAGGSGSRMNLAIPKQYLHLHGKPIIAHSIEKFQQFSEILVVIKPADELLFRQLFPNVRYVFGGEKRKDSVRNGLLALRNINPDYVIIHDAARPYISVEKIRQIIATLPFHNAIVVAKKLNDTLRDLDGNTIDRDKVIAISTPQAFDYKLILSVHMKFIDEDFTDDAALIIADQGNIHIMEDDPENIKITTQSDYKARKICTGIGFDVHKFVEAKESEVNIRIGGVDIAFSKAIEAHSDGDVVLHALVDAILGAVAEGDIGEYFPPSDPQWKNADSLLFVQKAREILESKNAVINNIDITIIAEKPKILPHKAQMKKKIADALEISADIINIKGKTTEKLGFLGREEGIAAQVIVTIEF